MVCLYIFSYACSDLNIGHMIFPYRLMDLTDIPGAYSVTQGPKLVPSKNVKYNLSSPPSISVAPTLMACGEFPGEYLQASSNVLPTVAYTTAIAACTSNIHPHTSSGGGGGQFAL